MTYTDNDIQALATQRLQENLNKVVRLALITYNKQPLAYRNFASVDRYVRQVVMMTYQGFYQEVKAEISRNQVSMVSKFFGKFKVRIRVKTEVHTNV